ncbi:MAG: pantetheine-phosphate adenylyltransferase [bacterium]|nr:pantetheine-phosphate adenylyltransferase [bacterium]
MKIGIYPGSFDPVTFGHIDIIERASKMFDKLYVLVSFNNAKNAFFTPEERVEIIKEVIKPLKNVEVISSSKLTVEVAKELGATALIRGLRAVTDFEYELQMASTNRTLNGDIETIFLMTNTQYSYLSSHLVKEIFALHGNISHFVPKYVEDRLIKKVKEEKTK